MPSRRRKLLPLCIAATLLSGLGMEAAAIGVGDIHLQSFLGSPLQAEIPLNHLDDLSIDQLKVQLGSQNDYGAMGVDYSYLHTQFKIEPLVRNGQGYVRISTREPITEPYLDFVLTLRWPHGQLVREFTVLLDPPAQAVAAAAVPLPAMVEAEPIATASAERAVAPKRRQSRGAEAMIAANAVPAETAESAAVQSAAVQGTAVEATAAQPFVEKSYTTQRGDSLWRIARRLQAAAPVEQVMAAIQSGNPHAFIDGNSSLLKEAVTIVLPNAEQIAAAGSARRPAVADSVPARVTAQVEQKATPVANVVPEAGATPVVAALVEENSALKSQVSDLTGNVAALNDNLTQSEQRLHQLESQLADLIQQMRQQRATVEAMQGVPEPQRGSELVQSAGSVINQASAADFGAVRARTPWWVHLLYWLGIGGAVTWAVREHFWPQRRLSFAAVAGGAMQPSMDEPEAGETQAPVLRQAAPVPQINTVAAAAELTLDFDEQPAVSSAISTEPAPQLLRGGDEPVDVSISAGVFVAFGRFGEAEQLLREALLREPERIELKLQLLDVYLQSDQPGAFDDLAAEIESEARTPETLAELAVLRDSYRR